MTVCHLHEGFGRLWRGGAGWARSEPGVAPVWAPIRAYTLDADFRVDGGNAVPR